MKAKTSPTVESLTNELKCSRQENYKLKDAVLILTDKLKAEIAEKQSLQALVKKLQADLEQSLRVIASADPTCASSLSVHLPHRNIGNCGSVTRARSKDLTGLGLHHEVGEHSTSNISVRYPLLKKQSSQSYPVTNHHQDESTLVYTPTLLPTASVKRIDSPRTQLGRSPTHTSPPGSKKLRTLKESKTEVTQQDQRISQLIRRVSPNILRQQPGQH